MRYLKTSLNILFFVFLPYYFEIWFPWFEDFRPNNLFYIWMFGFVRLEILFLILFFIYNLIKVLSENKHDYE